MSIIGYINIALEIFGGLLSLIFIICLSLTDLRKEKLERMYIHILLVNMILLFCDAAAWIFKGRSDIWAYCIVRIANFGVFLFGYILLAVFTDYLVCLISSKGEEISRVPSRAMWGLTALAAVLVILSQFNHMYYIIDENNIYHRQEWFWVSQMFGIFCMFINGGLLIRYRNRLEKREIGALSTYIGMPVIAMFIQILIYGVAVLNIAITLSALCIYISIQVEQSRQFARKELELEKSRTAIMLSQIRPHFLYNSLSVIKGLCQTDPVKAELAVDHFSDFLRGNLSSLSGASMIPFKQELSHTRHYLELEKMRFGERIRVIYTIIDGDFDMPPLTLQPIVENAVRHGITKREGGGTIRITALETKDAYIITVADDGVGFDQEKMPQDGREHIGMDNVRRRLHAQCKGSLSVRSTPGTGATAVITIPKITDEAARAGDERK